MAFEVPTERRSRWGEMLVCEVQAAARALAAHVVPLLVTREEEVVARARADSRLLQPRQSTQPLIHLSDLARTSVDEFTVSVGKFAQRVRRSTRPTLGDADRTNSCRWLSIENRGPRFGRSTLRCKSISGKGRTM